MNLIRSGPSCKLLSTHSPSWFPISSVIDCSASVPRPRRAAVRRKACLRGGELEWYLVIITVPNEYLYLALDRISSIGVVDIYSCVDGHDFTLESVLFFLISRRSRSVKFLQEDLPRSMFLILEDGRLKI